MAFALSNKELDMLTAAGMITIAFAGAALLARRLAAAPLFQLMGAGFASWADASRHGPEWQRS